MDAFFSDTSQWGGGVVYAETPADKCEVLDRSTECDYNFIQAQK